MKPIQQKAAGTGGLLASVAVGLLIGLAVPAAVAQRVIPNFEIQPYTHDTGVQTNDTAEIAALKPVVIKATNAPGTMRIHFQAFNLGKGSYVQLTSLRDGGRQKLDTISMGYWQNTSAIFNGDEVLFELVIASGDKGVFAQVDHLVLQCNCPEKIAGIADIMPLTLCGADSRVASSDNRVGRINGCTAWLVSNGAVLTAGHCGPVSGVFSVNVPPSSASGIPAASAPEDQFPIDTSNRTSVDNGQGDDYTVFALLPNNSTGSRAHILHGFFRMSRETPAAATTIRVTGFGVDNTPAGPVPNCCATDDIGNCTHPNCNAQSRTLQTATGSYVGETVVGVSDIFHEYQTDTEPANSGSPIIWSANGFTIGIHTHGGCGGAPNANSGTSFENNGLESLLQNFPGANTRYLDAVTYPNAPASNGTIFQPYHTLPDAVTGVPDGGIISVVEGNYTAAAGNTGVFGTGNKSFTFDVPVGGVIIGN